MGHSSYGGILGRLTRKRPIRRRETDVIKPSHSNKRPTRRYILRSTRWEPCKHDSGNREEQAIGKIAADHRPPATDLVDEQDTAQLRDQSQYRRDTLVLQRVVRLDAHVREDSWRVVLDRGYAGHLDTSLNGADEHETAEGRLVLEQLHIRLGGVFVLVLDGVADLVVLGAHPGVVFVAVGVQSGESLEAFLGLAVIDEPSVTLSVYGQDQPRCQEIIPRRLREQHNQQRKHHSRNNLNPQAKTPLHRIIIRKILVCSKRRPRRNERSNAQHKLLQRSNTATDRRVRNLSLVQRDNHDQETNTNARDNASSVQVFHILRRGLQGTTEDKND